MRRPALIVASIAAAVTVALPTAAYAETQMFEGEGGSASAAYNAAWTSAQLAGYVKSQCTFRTYSAGHQDYITDITCSR